MSGAVRQRGLVGRSAMRWQALVRREGGSAGATAGADSEGVAPLRVAVRRGLIEAGRALLLEGADALAGVRMVVRDGSLRGDVVQRVRERCLGGGVDGALEE